MVCENCGKNNPPVKKCCERCGKFLVGWTLNNVTGEYGHRNEDGSFTVPKTMKIWDLIIAQLRVGFKKYRS